MDGHHWYAAFSWNLSKVRVLLAHHSLIPIDVLFSLSIHTLFHDLRYYFDLLYAWCGRCVCCVCVCLLWKKRKDNIFCVRVAHSAHTKHIHNSMLFIFFAYLYPPTHYTASSDSEHTYITREMFCVSSYLYSCSLVFLFFFIFYKMLLFFLSLSSSSSSLSSFSSWHCSDSLILLEILIFFFLHILLSSCVPCNQIKWRMISYFLTSNYTTAVLIWLMRWKATVKHWATLKTLILKIMVTEKYASEFVRMEHYIKMRRNIFFLLKCEYCDTTLQ